MNYDTPVVLMTHLPTGTRTPREWATLGLTLAQAVRKIIEEPNPGLNRATASIRYGAQRLGYTEIAAIHDRPDFPRR